MTIPNIADLPEAEARKRLHDAGYRGKFHIETKAGCEWERNIAEGAVCRTQPPIGQKVGHFITLHLAGPTEGTDGLGRFGKMPNLLGWPADRARAHLEKLGYKKIEITTTGAVHNSTDNVDCRPNRVCFQTPSPNKKSYYRWPKRLAIGQPPPPKKPTTGPGSTPSSDKGKDNADKAKDKGKAPDKKPDDGGSYFD